jgi:hypothetical protein
MGRGRGGGRGWRNQYRASGLTGWERAAQAEPYAAPGEAPSAFADLKEALGHVGAGRPGAHHWQRRL